MKKILHQFQGKYPSCRYIPWCRIFSFYGMTMKTHYLWLDNSISIKGQQCVWVLPAGLYGGGLAQLCVSVWVHLWRGSQCGPLPPPGPGWPHLHPAHTAPPGTEQSLADTHTQIQLEFLMVRKISLKVKLSGGHWPDCLLPGGCWDTQWENNTFHLFTLKLFFPCFEVMLLNTCSFLLTA